MTDMTGNNHPDHKQASKEATDWLILLHDDPQDIELQRVFEAWREKSPANAAAWEAMQQASRAMGRVKPAHAERWQPDLAALRATAGTGAMPSGIFRTHYFNHLNGWRAGGVINRGQAMRWGGLAAAACLLALFLMPGLLLNLRADYASTTAETSTIRLLDDSAVTLAPKSAIAVAYTPNARRIRILAGEVLFDVRPNAERPFEVAIKDIQVTVLGTGFVVRRSDEGADIAVEHGAVRVGYTNAAPPVAETLTAGEAVRVSWAGRTERRTVPVDQIAAWRRNELIARDAPLERVVDRLGAYYAGTIVITSGSLAARPVTGVYDLNDPVSALHAMARAQNAIVRRITPWLIIVSPS